MVVASWEWQGEKCKAEMAHFMARKQKSTRSSHIIFKDTPSKFKVFHRPHLLQAPGDQAFNTWAPVGHSTPNYIIRSSCKAAFLRIEKLHALAGNCLEPC